MINIIGGKKVAVNLYKVLQNHSIESKLFYFENEQASKKKGFLSIEFFKDLLEKENSTLIVTSETAFNHLKQYNLKQFESHFYLRGKKNIGQISKEINALEVPVVDPDKENDLFPFIAKPSTSASDVPFKIKIVSNASELKEVESYFPNCVLQKYLDKDEYFQIAVAGYFTGHPDSFISVKQLNQYPVGISSHVMVTHEYEDLKKDIANYLNKLSFTGFIELEFKISRTEKRQIYLIDVNPRLWGWSYYYISTIQNMNGVIFNGEKPALNLKKEWINPPRYFFSLLNFNVSFPKVQNLLSNKISFEPFF